MKLFLKASKDATFLKKIDTQRLFLFFINHLFSDNLLAKGHQSHAIGRSVRDGRTPDNRELHDGYGVIAPRYRRDTTMWGQHRGTRPVWLMAPRRCPIPEGSEQ
ncbi:hypothetical protein [Novacetimonas sp. GS1]|uniref:hypothetical protein n=1 Tax=Novacetimonas sp. GS1 TaxID=3119990 RepID=UPI002FCD2773